MASRAYAVLTCALALLAASTVASPVREQNGVFALFAGKQQIAARMRRIGNDEVDLVQVHPNGTPVTAYVSVAGALIHVFVVRDDFKKMLHVHPRVLGNGHFSVAFMPDRDHRYYAFVDSFPAGTDEQAFRFTLQSGSPPHHLDTTLQRPSATQRVGPYTVSLSSARLVARTPVTLTVSVRHGSRIVTPRKGQTFQTVAAIVNTSTLQYISVYEGHSGGLLYPGEYDRPQLTLPALPAGIYRLWLELRLGGKSTFAAFTLAAQ